MLWPIIDDDFKTETKNLGKCNFDSPLSNVVFYSDEFRMICNPYQFNVAVHLHDGTLPKSVEVAGPRRKIFFDPKNTKAAIVSCGGLCPGLNNVIRDITMSLYHNYGVENIWGIPFGYRGFIPEYGHELIKLNPDVVDDLHTKGGTILASSRGTQSEEKIVDFLVENNFNMIFTIGGDGTLKGAHTIYQEIEKRKLPIAIVGIPKTIDNDIAFISHTFGFYTAVSVAAQAVFNVHTEAKGALNGIGLVKLMGRESGFIACAAALAANEANFVLIPEIKFDLDGKDGFLDHLKHRILKRGHAVIIVAEGAGQDFLPNQGKDKSGNIIFGDIGIFLRDNIKNFFKQEKIEISMKYIDPSYMIRSVPANAFDSIYCTSLAQAAVHAAMAGKTDICVGNMNSELINIPISTVISHRKRVDPRSFYWQNVLMSTGMKCCHSEN